MSISAKWLVLWSLWLARLARQPTVELSVGGGRLRGSIAPDGSHAFYLAIPYATVSREHRFQGSTREPTWEGVFEAIDENIRCSQRYTSTIIAGQEDCLIVNIYTPLSISEKLPVMVFIHGGGFRDGSGSPLLYGPEYLVKHGVILVTFNYRLEVLGFLCLGIKEAPGNVGLKDQVAALKWIKNNIAAFGGDPEKITLFGESAGSASVMLHLISPMSKGLFHKAIMQSGSAISPWSLQFDPKKTAILYANMMGVKTENPHELYNLFMNKTTKELLSTRVPREEGDVVLSENIFVPCIEDKVADVENFLNDSPYDLLSRGMFHNVPIIIGFNSAEGLMLVGKENATTVSKLDIYKSVPRDLVFPSSEEKIETVDKLKRIYTNGETIGKHNLVNFSRFEGDSGITYPTIATADILLRTNTKPVYAYKFSYDGWLNIVKFYFGFSKVPGATHADELFYIFKTKIPLFMAFFERDLIDKMTAMWTNFAKYSDPTPDGSSANIAKWRPTRKIDPHIFVIDKQFSTEPLWSDANIRFWNSTYTKYRRKI